MATWRPFLALILAVFVTVGLSVSAVYAGGMSAKMDMMSSMGADGGGDCSACPGGADNGGKPMVCSPVCVAPAVAFVAQDLPVVLAIQASRLSPAPESLLRGRDSLPDPSPPRSSDRV